MVIDDTYIRMSVGNIDEWMGKLVTSHHGSYVFSLLHQSRKRLTSSQDQGTAPLVELKY
jgi:hypothetical protein